MLVVEHPADDEVTTTHVHVAVRGVRSKAARIDKVVEALRKWLPPSLKGTGQYVIMSRTQQTRVLYDWDKLAIYMLKGDKDLLKFKTDDISDLCIDDWVAGYKHYDREVRPVSEKKREYTQWTLIEEVRKEGVLQEKILDDGRLVTVCVACKENWNMMMDKLDKNRIRTSKHELERIWVSIIRADPVFSSDMYEEITKKLLSNRYI